MVTEEGGSQCHVKDSRQNRLFKSFGKRKIAELRRKIERGTENLALADRDDFKAISTLLQGWRDEESALAERLAQRGKELEPLSVLARFADVPKNLDKADRAKLAHAISQTVDLVTIGIRNTACGEIEYRELTGELRFYEAFAISPIEIPDETIGQRRIWREFGVLAKQADHPLHLADFCEHLQSPDPSHAAYHVRRAEKAGMIRKIGHQGG